MKCHCQKKSAIFLLLTCLALFSSCTDGSKPSKTTGLPTSTPILIGHMVGGITSPVVNPFSFNQTNQTMAELNKVDLDVAVNAIMGSMLKNGYMAEEIVTMLVSVENESDKKTSELLEKIVFQLETLIENNGHESTILSQKLNIDADIEVMAEMYQISVGKAYLVNHIYGEHPTMPVKVLSAMNINELVDLFLNTIADDDDIELRGSVVADSHQDLFDRALVLTRLFEKWQLDPASIRSATVELDEDRLVYEVEVSESDKKFKALVDAKNGEILDEDWDEHYLGPTAPAPTGTTAPTAAPEPTASAPTGTTAPTAAPEPTASAPTGTTVPTVAPEPTGPGQVMMLSASEARQMVINRFGGIVQKIEYNYDDKNPLYKGEALKEGYKVVFEINARTRTWHKWDISNENSWDDFAFALPDMITIDEAANSVIRKSGNSGTFIQKIDFLWPTFRTPKPPFSEELLSVYCQDR